MPFRGDRRRFLVLCVPSLLSVSRRASAQRLSQVDRALSFFRRGGAYCFRVAPEGVAMAEETEWAIMLLTSSSNRKNEFKIRQLDPGASRLGGNALKSAGEAVTGVWRTETSRQEFFERFGLGIEGGLLRARLVRIAPNNLAQLTTDRARAELYLQWSDRGSTVAFKGVPDLTAEEFAQYSSYFPD